MITKGQLIILAVCAVLIFLLVVYGQSKGYLSGDLL